MNEHKHYQGLFDLMYDYHGITCTISEMDDIIYQARLVVESVNKESKDCKLNTNKMELTKEKLIEIGQKVEDLSELLLPLEDIGTEIVQFIEQITGQKIENKNKVENANPEY